MSFWRPYISVAQRRAQAQRELKKLAKKGLKVQPVEIRGRKIASSFWGKGWCDHMESFSDYANRLPRGRTYARNGSVCHLEVLPGQVKAKVSGSDLYDVEIQVRQLESATWAAIKEECTGQVGSLLELLEGKLSDQVMSVVSDRRRGLFPQPREIEFACSCPDWAKLCKHVAAVLYGVGSRLDHQPELLFRLREVNPEELLGAQLFAPSQGPESDTLADEVLSDIFGIDLDFEFEPAEQAELAFECGHQVESLRKRLDLTVGEFARRLGVTQESVYRWEASSRLNLRRRSLAALKELAREVHAAHHDSR